MLNSALPQFKIEINGQGIHFVHIKSEHSSATPLLMVMRDGQPRRLTCAHFRMRQVHGWPGSFVECLHVAKLLTTSNGTSRAFHLVCPSLPVRAAALAVGRPVTAARQPVPALAIRRRSFGWSRIGLWLFGCAQAEAHGPESYGSSLHRADPSARVHEIPRARRRLGQRDRIDDRIGRRAARGTQLLPHAPGLGSLLPHLHQD